MNSVEVAAAIGAGAAIVGSLGAGLLTYWASTRQVKAIKEEAAQQRTHDSEELRLEREAAQDRSREDRLHRDKVKAARTLVRYGMHAQQLAAWHKKSSNQVGQTPEPSLSPVFDDAARVTARLFASEAATAKLDELSNIVNAMMRLKASSESADPAQQPEMFKKLEHACEVVEEQAVVLMGLARDDVNPLAL